MRGFLTGFGLMVGFAALMAAGAQIDVPMRPVPMTLQSFAILLAGLWLGPIRGAGAVLLYLVSAAAGLPVLAEGSSGLEPFSGATAGYIYAFPVAAFLAGLFARLAEKRPSLSGALASIATLFILHLILLGGGTLWLSTRIGFADAMSGGFTPFLIGAGVKSALCWLVWRADTRFRRGGTG